MYVSTYLIELLCSYKDNMYMQYQSIYTTIGIDECSLGVDNTSIPAKPYILQKICFQRLYSKFLAF